jgi:sugar phosphate permease
MPARLSRVFYGWWMVGAGFGLQLLVAGLFQQSFGAYVVLLHDNEGWSKTALSAAYSIQQVEAALIGPVQGFLIDRFGPRSVMRVGVVIFGIGFMLFSRVESLMTFYFAIVLFGLGAQLTGFFPVTVAVVNWFERRRARALSTMSIGFAVGGVIVPLVALSLEAAGWRTTAFASGVLIIVAGIPLVQIMRHRPEDYGEVPDGRNNVDRYKAEEARKPSKVPATEAGSRDFTAKEALRTPAFWFISLGHGSALLIVSAVTVHAASYLKQDLGYSLGAASLVITLMTLTQVLGLVISGVIGDKLDKRYIAFACMGMHALALMLVAYAQDVPMVIAFAVLHGAAWGIRGPLMQAIRAEYFGRASYGMILGLSSLVFTLGNIAGPLVAGILADTTGGYREGFTVLTVLSGAGSLFFLLAKRPQRPRVAPSAIAVEVLEPLAGG